jgi:muramoyltetrapeptide carboxypeptidase
MKLLPVLPGDCIGVMAPSSFVERSDVEKSQAALEAKGYKVYIHPQTNARHHQSAGTHKEKLQALHELYEDERIHAIWAAGGGNRALYLLDDLDYALIKKNPKPLIGFSDVTTLLNAITARTSVVNIHAQVFKNLHGHPQFEDTLAVLAGERKSLSLTEAQIVQDGKASGLLVGGNLSLFHYLCGTLDCPPLEGAILFLEDCGEELSRFDRMFAQMRRLGVFKKIGALVLGEFTDVRDGGRPFGFTLEEIVRENVAERRIPVVLNAPFGHGKTCFALPVGHNAALDTATGVVNF